VPDIKSKNPAGYPIEPAGYPLLFFRVFKECRIVFIIIFACRSHPFFPETLFGHAPMPPSLWYPRVAIVRPGVVDPQVKRYSRQCTPWTASPFLGKKESPSKIFRKHDRNI
jgi:hypothetical protein